MRRSISRIAAYALSTMMALGAAAVPCAAGPAPALKAQPKTTLTRLSPTTRTMLARPASATSAQAKDPGATAPSSPSSFFHSTRGKVTLVLMGAAVGFTLYSAHHDRIPVKSPVR